MTTTTDKRNAARTWRDWHEIYESWPIVARRAVDDSYRALCEVLTDRGYQIPGDDAAEQLIGEIARFLLSRPPKPSATIETSHGTVCPKCLLWPDLCACNGAD